jgi:hypothetical protein
MHERRLGVGRARESRNEAEDKLNSSRVHVKLVRTESGQQFHLVPFRVRVPEGLVLQRLNLGRKRIIRHVAHHSAIRPNPSKNNVGPNTELGRERATVIKRRFWMGRLFRYQRERTRAEQTVCPTPYSPAPHVLFPPPTIPTPSGTPPTSHAAFPPPGFAGLPFCGVAGETWQNGMVFAEGDSETVRGRWISMSFGDSKRRFVKSHDGAK